MVLYETSCSNYCMIKVIYDSILFSRPLEISFFSPLLFMLYQVRDPMPAVFFFLIDVSMNALQTGATAAACSAISQVISDLPVSFCLFPLHLTISISLFQKAHWNS